MSNLKKKNQIDDYCTTQTHKRITIMYTSDRQQGDWKKVERLNEHIFSLSQSKSKHEKSITGKNRIEGIR